METFALLCGTLVLFICLLIAMYLTKDFGRFSRKDSDCQTYEGESPLQENSAGNREEN